MCLNFLGLIHMDSHIIKTHILETHYTQVNRSNCNNKYTLIFVLFPYMFLGNGSYGCNIHNI